MSTGPTQGAGELPVRAWARRRGAATAVRAVATLGPVVMAWLVTHRLSPVLWRPAGAIGAVAWIVQVAAIGGGVVHLTGRAARRLLPLAALLDLSLVFPDHAPSRFRTALRAGTIRNLQAKVDQVRHGRAGTDDAVATIVELVGALGRHERLTRGHTERVRAYADMIAEELGVPAADRHLLQWACLLHDIGKLAVPATILNKNGRPTDEEWATLQRHPAVGGEIVEPLAGWLGEWRFAASQHHERWDGTGYPHRLAGTQISLAGRIVAVADAYDVITSTRSYKKPMSAEAARAELVKCAGTQFDPDVVRAFLSVSIGRVSAAIGSIGWLPEAATFGGIGQSATGAIATLGATAAITVAAMTTVPNGPGVDAITAAPREAPGVVAPAKAPTTTASPPDVVASPGDAAAKRIGGPAAKGTPTTTAPGGPGTTGATGAAAVGGPAARPGGTPTTTARPAAAGAAPATTAPGGDGSGTGATTSTTTTAPDDTGATTTVPTTTAGAPPAPGDDDVLVLLASTTEIDVLANDGDPDGDLDPTSLAIVTAPGRGSTTVTGSTITYRAGLTLGSTSFTYRVCDRGGRCATAVVRLTVVSL